MVCLSRVFQSSELPLLLLERWLDGTSCVDVRVSRCSQGILIEACGKSSAVVSAFFANPKPHAYARS